MISIKQQLLSGVFYTAIARYSGVIISLLVTAVLARLLTPADFGIVAIATIFINFFNIFTNIGISAALIQNKELTTKDINGIYMFTIWMGIGLSILFFLSAWGIAAYYQDSRLTSICHLLAISLFFSAIAIVPNTLFFRDKDFKFIAYRTFIIQVLSGILSIAIAYTGAGLYTLIVQPILSNLLIFIISLKKYPQKLFWGTGITSLRKIWKYSFYQFLFNITGYFTRNLDKLLIGKYIGMIPLGFYEKSYRLMSLPLQNITYVITPVMHPILCDYQNDLHKLAEIHERMVRLLAFIGFPLGLLLFFCADELILLIFGDQWIPSISIFKVLSLSVGFQLILSSSGSFYQAGNDTKGLFICGIFTSITSCIGLIIGIFIFGSLKAVTYCMLFICIACFIQCYHQLYHGLLKRKLYHFYQQLLSPLILSALIGGLLFILSEMNMKINIFLSLCIKSILCFMACCCYIQKTREYDILSKLKQFINKKKYS